MKISNLTSALLGLLFFLFCTVATSENQIRILLNNGNPIPNNPCTDMDMNWIMRALPTTARRNLRQGKDAMDQSFDMNEPSGSGRKLAVVFYPASCKTSCSAFATGSCVVAGCKGYRREMEETEDDERSLQTAIDQQWCESATNRANFYIDTVLPSPEASRISSACLKIVQLPRKIECLKVFC